MVTEIRRADKERTAEDPFFGYLLSENTELLESVGLRPKSEVFGGALTATQVYFSAKKSGVTYFANPVLYHPQETTKFTMLAQLTGLEGGANAGVPELRRKITDISRLEGNWDDEGASRMSPLTIKRALQVVEHIAVVLERKITSSSPSVLPFPDGSIFFKWVHGPRELNITVEGNHVTAQHWQPLDSYSSLGLWPISVDDTSEHVEWVLA